MENGPSKEQVAGLPPLLVQLPHPKEELTALTRHGQMAPTRWGTSLPPTLL